jgi:hypothetical protein
MSIAKEIKAKLSLRDAARLCGIELPERDKVKFRAPFRPDQTPSCTVFRDRITDWSTGEKIDAIELYALAKRVTTKQAIGELAGHLGLNGNRHAGPIRKWPEFDTGTQADAAALIETRGFSSEGLRLARDRGLLRFGKVCGSRSWIVTDASGRVAQARRVDGKQYPAFGEIGERKSHTLAGSKQSWPLGVMEAGRLQNVLFVEGAPDFLAAHCFIAWAGRQDDTCAVAVLGAGNKMPEHVLTVLEGKRVRILPHTDEAGKRALRRWTRQLIGAGAKVDAFDFKGLIKPDDSPVEDLNDLLRAPEHIAAWKEVCIP